MCDSQRHDQRKRDETEKGTVPSAQRHEESEREMTEEGTVPNMQRHEESEREMTAEGTVPTQAIQLFKFRSHRAFYSNMASTSTGLPLTSTPHM